MSKITNGALNQYGAEPFEQQQFGIASVEGVKPAQLSIRCTVIQLYLFTVTVWEWRETTSGDCNRDEEWWGCRGWH